MVSGREVEERVRRLSTALADVKFPATKWELFIHVEFIGADIRTRTDLDRLPAGRYVDLASVISVISVISAIDGDRTADDDRSR
jgi:hypothetical protein